ncbi:MAG: restriction endonuclease subunit S [Fibrobacteraceae bacterium]|nr:restriction endonuclease subunit S [Fibrobacteraceae bacterium]
MLNQIAPLYNYGRARILQKIKEEIIALPVKSDLEGNAIVDEEKKYSCDGFIPDWDWMEHFVLRLHLEPLKTRINKRLLNFCFDVGEWKNFFLSRLFNAGMGNGIDSIATSNENPKYNYVSRDSNGNGVVGFVDEIEDEIPFPAGAMSLALGGSYLGSCFIQKKPFYTAQNVAVLQEKIPLSTHVKLFLAALIRNECKVKYQAFGRELNSHYKKDFSIKLPIKKKNGSPVIDDEKIFSDEGYIPDWDWIEGYMKTLPYSDRLD